MNVLCHIMYSYYKKNLEWVNEYKLAILELFMNQCSEFNINISAFLRRWHCTNKRECTNVYQVQTIKNSNSSSCYSNK